MGLSNSTNYIIGGGEIPTGLIKNIDIHWVNGNVIVEPTNGTVISISERVIRGRNKNPLEYKVEEDTLTIHFSSESIASFHFHDFITKELTLLVPEELANSIENLNIHTASSDVFLKNLTCNNLHIETSSGKYQLDHLKVNKMHYKTASGTLQMADCNLDDGNMKSSSGNIQFNGMLHSLATNNVSGNTEVISTISPEFLSLESVSGMEKIILPEYSSFRAVFKTVSGKFKSTYPCAIDANEMTCGTGSGKYHFKTVSGNIELDKLAPEYYI